MGRSLGLLLKGGEVIELQSDLGGGKTTFVKGLAAGVDSPDYVTSPTFTIKKTYTGKDLQLNHFDFYRLSDVGLIGEQLKESIHWPKTVTVIEWGKIVDDVLPLERISIDIKPDSKQLDTRIIEINYPDLYANLVRKFGQNIESTKP